MGARGPPGLWVVADSSFRAATFDRPCILFLLRLLHTTTNPNQPKAESKQQTTRLERKKARRRQRSTPTPTPSRHSPTTQESAGQRAGTSRSPSTLRRPLFLPLRRSPGWFLLFALLLPFPRVFPVHGAWWMQAGPPRPPMEGWLYWFFLYVPKMKKINPAAAGRIMERGVLGSRGAGAVRILGMETGAATWVLLGLFSSCHFLLWSGPVRSGIVPWN